jgi:hypothetical protein
MAKKENRMTGIHRGDCTLRILGGDPGAVTGLVVVEFPMRRRDGSPLWMHAKLRGHAVVGKPEQKGATPAELDILHRRKLAQAITDLNHIASDIVALEEPLDGGGSWKGAQGQRGQRRDTAFRLGVHYANLLAAAAMVSHADRYVSFPVQTRGERRGWFPPRTKRGDVLQRCHMIMHSICTNEQWTALPKEKASGLIVPHVLMALGVVNFLVEHYTETFPQED